MKVAFTSSDGNLVDCHFGSSEAFFVWEVDPDKARCLGHRSIPNLDGQEIRIVARTNLLLDCAIVCTAQIGGPAAAKAGRPAHSSIKTLPQRPSLKLCNACRGSCAGIPRPGCARPWVCCRSHPFSRPTQPHDREESSMAYITGITRGRQEWTPRFVKTVDDNKCIGCAVA